MAMPIVIVDAFTAAPFAGNPAAVCLLDAPASPEWMQHVAGEMNLSETAFVVSRGAAFDLRWFTPAIEVDLCGHATLAAAHVLWETGRLPPAGTARFSTRSGTLTARKADDWIELDFPATPVRPLGPEDGPPTAWTEALGTTAVEIARSRFDVLVEVEHGRVVRALAPDMARLAALPARGVIVTSRSDVPGVDFVSRFFAPAAGIDEDPVTGSAHCALAPYWSERLGRDEFLAHQVSARGGVLRVALAGDRVRIGGQAVTVMRGELVA
jgi:PhzF family phenazine biosynthesis protein